MPREVKSNLYGNPMPAIYNKCPFRLVDPTSNVVFLPLVDTEAEVTDWTKTQPALVLPKAAPETPVKPSK